MTLNQLFLKPTREKCHPLWGYFRGSSKNIYNFPKIMQHITPWTLTLMLYIRQAVYLVLINLLSSSFLMFCITIDEIRYFLYNSGKKLNILDTCGAMIRSYFGIAFLLFFIKIENAVYTSWQSSTLLFINGLIFDIMNIQNNQSYEYMNENQ